MSRKTALITNHSNIIEQIARDLDNARFSKLPTSLLRKYFNDQGTELTAGSDEIVFVAEIDPTQPASLPLGETVQPYLRRFIIRVANSSDRDFSFSGKNTTIRYSTFNHLVAQTRL